VRDCPYPTLNLADFATDMPVGTPYFIARRAPCEMCEDIPCVKACPTGALDPKLTDIYKSRRGLAVLIDDETCLNMQGLRCDVCERVCPLIGEAITLERFHNPRTGAHAIFVPTVHSDKCTGCGKCEHACVLEKAAIRVMPRSLAKGRIGEHYRLGWVEEKNNKGKSLVPGIVDMPDRMPEGVHIVPRGPDL
jgi:ferredoxin-type protein NapG